MEQKIIKEMYMAAYEYGKKVYFNKITEKDAVELVNVETGMNLTSATYYIESIIGMISGTEYRYYTNEEATDYYIYKIKEDFGIDGIRNSLKAIEKHIEWQERNNKKLPKYLYIVVNDLKNNVLSMWDETSS